MNRFLRLVLCVGFVFSCFLTLSMQSAQAFTENEETIRVAQMHLANLRYYYDGLDGVLGPNTKKALIQFQRDNALPASGTLTHDTFAVLVEVDNNNYRVKQSSYPSIHTHHTDLANVSPPKTDYVHQPADHISYSTHVSTHSWNFVHVQSIPNRFSQVELREFRDGTHHNYEVNVGGRSVLIAKNQASYVKVSQTFALNDEDAVIITARNNDGACPFKSYLLTLNFDSTNSQPREIGNCSSAYEVHISGQALLVTFHEDDMTGGLSYWDGWRYENSVLAHV